MSSISQMAVWESLYLSVHVHSHTGNHMHTTLSLSASIQLLLLSYITTSHSCLFSPFFPPSLHWAFEALSLFIPPPLLALKAWSVTELDASFIGFSQQPGDKGQLKCNNVSIFFLCADASAWKENDVQSSALQSWNTVEDGWRQTRRMRTMERRRRMGACFIIDYPRSQAKWEAR